MATRPPGLSHSPSPIQQRARPVPPRTLLSSLSPVLSPPTGTRRVPPARRPPPMPTRDWPPISSDEIRDALAWTSNSSAPGLSGINYKLLKWAFAANPTRFVDLYNECLDRGIHPWTTAKVVPIAKPNKADYSLPKAYRPISLLECCGKLLERIVATCLLFDLNEYSILPPSQFGSRDKHCAIDAAMVIAHTAQQGRASGFPTALLLFDIQGFFDNVCRDHLVYLLRLFGFPDHVADWVHSFLSNRHVALHFNGESSLLFAVLNGTPQGSPLSPIISAIYTIPLLRRAERWEVRSGSLQLYVDDGGIVAAGATHRSAIQKAAAHYEDATDWLHRCGLRTDPDKCELIVFHNSRWSPRLKGSLPSHIGLRDAVHGEFTVTRSTLVRYLGIFFHESLKWEEHVKIMANRARSTIRSLHILGNSIRGIDYAAWRKVFHAIVLPVLTYGAPLWASNPPKYLLQRVRVAQNDALRRIAGCFRTTPVDPLHHLLAILPPQYTLAQLVGSYSDRLTRLPPTHALRTITTHNPAAVWDTAHIPTSLTRITPSHFPRHYTRSHPCCPVWSHPLLSLPPPHSAQESEETRARLHQRLGLRLFIVTHHTADSSQSLYALFRDTDHAPIHQGIATGRNPTAAQWSALLLGMSHALHTSRSSPLLILLPNRLLVPYLTNRRNHTYLPQTTQFTELLDDFIMESSPTEIRIFSPKWKNMPYALALNSFLASEPALPPSTHNPSRREQAFSQWQTDYDRGILPRRGAAWISVTRPEGTTPPPFTLGALTPLTRRYFSACMQLTTRHCFEAGYSLKFRASAGDEVRCPCNFSRHLDGSAVSGGPMKGRTGTEAGSQRNAVRTPLDFDALQRLYLDPAAVSEEQDDPPPLPRRDPHSHTHLYTLHHVLTACPLTVSQRTKFLRNCSVEELFRSELGAKRLCCFIHFTRAFLRPLPPRPDPP